MRTMYIQVSAKGVKLKKNWQMILLMMKMTYPSEDRRAAIELAVMRGSKRVIAKTVEMKTKIEVKKSVILTWIRCAPEKHCSFGKKARTWIFGSVAEGWQLMMLSKNSVTGMKRSVTNKGTICARSTSGSVNLNFFLLKE